jgi:hypothetical protein
LLTLLAFVWVMKAHSGDWKVCWEGEVRWFVSSCVTISESISSGRDLLQILISSSSLRTDLLAVPKIRKIFMAGNRGTPWRFSRRRATGNGMDSCSDLAAWSASESMAELMVLAMEASDGDVEDTQRRDFSREALGA